jgi:RecB family exonuclease
MARKPTLSPSRITTFLACPVKYKWTYVDRRGRWYLRSKAHYSFGTSLHNVLQRFYDSKDGGVTTTEEAVAALEEAWIDAGYESQSDMMEALAEGKDILTNYLEEVAAPVTANTLFVEKTLRHDLGPFVLLGRIDRLDEHEDGTLDVVDYKSGRGHVTSDEVHADLAMGVYQVLVRANYPDRNVKATIVALRAGASASAQLNEAEREEFINDLVEIGERILHADYESMEPTPKALCPRCDFLPLCQKHPDFAEGVKPWLAQASPTP